MMRLAPIPLQNARFQGMSDTIIGRIDEMGSKIEELEKSINELMAQTSSAPPAAAGAASASS